MFLPKEVKFFDLFDKQTENIVRPKTSARCTSWNTTAMN